MPTPTISNVMSVYNGAGHVCAAVEGILVQSRGDLELIIVDDGSTDGTGDVLAEYSRRDGRVRVIRSGNRGRSRPANVRVRCAVRDHDDFPLASSVAPRPLDNPSLLSNG